MSFCVLRLNTRITSSTCGEVLMLRLYRRKEGENVMTRFNGMKKFVFGYSIRME